MRQPTPSTANTRPGDMPRSVLMTLPRIMHVCGKTSVNRVNRRVVSSSMTFVFAAITPQIRSSSMTSIC